MMTYTILGVPHYNSSIIVPYRPSLYPPKGPYDLRPFGVACLLGNSHIAYGRLNLILSNIGALLITLYFFFWGGEGFLYRVP